jgi:hypothetical protein
MLQSLVNRPRHTPSRRSVVSAVPVLAVLCAACGESPAVPSPTDDGEFIRFEVPAGLSPALTSMLEGLPTYIIQARQQNEELLPRNLQYRTQITAKIEMLKNTSLAGEIAIGRRWAELEVTSLDGRAIPLVSIFALEQMRAEAGDGLRAVQSYLPLLERFFDRPFPTPVVRVWYGFVLGNSGGGGVIYTEDRSTYESRTNASRLPHDSILGHELAHSYIGNEGMNQFLELYVYNVARTGSTDPLSWPLTRGWTPGLAANENSAAMLDVYQLVGHDAMARAYRAVYPLRPPYGSPLAPAVIDAFAGQVPLELREMVREKLGRVRF